MISDGTVIYSIERKLCFLNYTEKLKDRSFGHIADHLKSLKQPIKTKYSFYKKFEVKTLGLCKTCSLLSLLSGAF